MIQTAHHLDDALRHELADFLGDVGPGSGACFEHDPRWLRVLEDGLGHTPMALIARGGSARSPIRGYLPLARVRSALFGRFLVSLPYLNRAGIVTNDDAARAALLDEAVALARALDCQYLELRHHERLAAGPAVTDHRDDKQRMVLGLPGAGDADALWTGLDAKVRNQVRKGDKSGLTVEFGGRTLLDAFYHVFAINMRDLGTPVYPRRLFGAVLHHFPEEAELAVVRLDGRPVAGALLVHECTGSARATQVPSASSLRAFNRSNANMWMYWQLLRRAVDRSSTGFDFGRSTPGSGTYRFKQQWGATPHPTVWQYHTRRGEVGTLRPDHPKMQRRVEQWKRLPVWVTRLVGPAIVRCIP